MWKVWGQCSSGAVVGLAGSFAATGALRTLLFGVTRLDPLSISGAPAVLVGVAFLASYLPARHALRVDPMVALRDE